MAQNYNDFMVDLDKRKLEMNLSTANARRKKITNETVEILTNLVIVLQDTCDYDQTFRFVLQFNLEDKIIFDGLLNPEWKGRPISDANKKIMVLAAMH